MIDLVYVDNHLLIVNKPAGLATQPHDLGMESLTERAKAWVKQKYNKPGMVFLEPVHRLDKPVSGLVLFARTSKALSRLQEMMRERTIRKTYLALVSPSPAEEEGVLEHYLIHEEHRARVVPSSHPEGKLARLTYRKTKEVDGMALLEIALETGRYHQIRVQLAAHHCPVLNDGKYGSRDSWKREGIALHHSELGFTHPVTREKLLFTALAPFDRPGAQ